MWRGRLFAVLAVSFVVPSCVGSAPELGQNTEGVFQTEDGEWVLQTGEFELEPGEERFICYAATVPEKLAVSRFESPANPSVHHFLLVEALAPEEPGFSSCETLFKLTWAPMYAAVTAPGHLRIPDGAAKILDRGTQVVLQIHLLNTSAEVVKDRVEVSLGVSPLADPVPVGITLFGDANFELAPGQQGVAQGTCVLKHDVALYALLPHMHYLGRKLEFQLDEGSGFETVYSRDPFDFGDQRFDEYERLLEEGTAVRVRCTYDNDRDTKVKFGEDAHSEMCLAVGFRVGGDEAFEFCSEVPPAGMRAPSDVDAHLCGQEESDIGLGRACTPAGGECPEALFCAADLLSIQRGFCFEVGCVSNADCGTGTCCRLPLLGSMANLCISEACRPDYCIPVDMLGE